MLCRGTMLFYNLHERISKRYAYHVQFRKWVPELHGTEIELALIRGTGISQRDISPNLKLQKEPGTTSDIFASKSSTVSKHHEPLVIKQTARSANVSPWHKYVH